LNCAPPNSAPSELRPFKESVATELRLIEGRAANKIGCAEVDSSELR
jgi:hypothetical protein